MAMGKCRDCDNDVSTHAPVCPKCGRKNPTRRKPIGCWPILGAVFGLAFLGAIVGKVVGDVDPNHDKKVADAKTADDADTKNSAALLKRIKIIDRCKDAISGSLNDPSGAEMPSVITDMDAYHFSFGKKTVVVRFAFRARNGFNALRGAMGVCTYKVVGTELGAMTYHVAT